MCVFLMLFLSLNLNFFYYYIISLCFAIFVLLSIYRFSLSVSPNVRKRSPCSASSKNRFFPLFICFLILLQFYMCLTDFSYIGFTFISLICKKFQAFYLIFELKTQLLCSYVILYSIAYIYFFKKNYSW
jgi:hypothetical protein